ncbi:MAG: DNA-binding transcriptional LysR family regulator [Parasphingorhabdus sp.]|jgi:DNA-binding transcriptional LysR family regulator
MFRFSVDQIQCFQAVVVEGSFNQAGERLGRAKSAVRYAINSLEEQLGFPLLDRRSYRPIPTVQGRSFLQRSEKLLLEYEELKVFSQQISEGVEARLAISASGLCDLSGLYSIIKQAMQLFPSTEIVLERELLSGERMLFREMVDIAIFENVRNWDDLEFKQIDHIRMVPVIAGDHAFLSLPENQQNLESLFQHPQIVQRSTIPDDDLQFGIYKQSLKWRVADTPSKREVILNGLGWGKLPEHLIFDDLASQRLVSIEQIDQVTELDVYLCRRKKGHMGQVARFIWDSF